MKKSDWFFNYNSELNHAEAARKTGNEGMARVCARRAAGIILREYFLRLGYVNNKSNSYNCIRVFVNQAQVSDDVKLVASHFLLSVNSNHKLPNGVDLIADIRWLTQELLGKP